MSPTEELRKHEHIPGLRRRVRQEGWAISVSEVACVRNCLLFVPVLVRRCTVDTDYPRTRGAYSSIVEGKPLPFFVSGRQC